MAFILELGYTGHQKTIPNFLVSVLREYEIESSVVHENGRIVCTMREDHPRLQEAVEKMGQIVPPSIFLHGSSHRFASETPLSLPEFFETLPLGLGVCPQCQKEMTDPSSRRYYYPFTACKHCGGQYAFFQHYPYVRENTALRSIEACEACRGELSANPYRLGYPQISCGECAIPLQITENGSVETIRETAGYQSLFERSARAILEGKRVRMKTTAGYRLFTSLGGACADEVLMVVNPSRLSALLALIEEEFQALLSIERPILHAAVADEELKAKVGSSVDVQYSDDGFAFLLGRELIRLGIDAVMFRPCDETEAAEIAIDFEPDIQTQSPMRVFVNKAKSFVAEGERGSFPAYVNPAADVASFAHGLAAIREGDRMVIDQIGRFGGTETSKVMALEGEELPFTHSYLHRFDQDTASCMAVLHENGIGRSSAVCAYFDERITFLLAKKGEIIRIVPFESFRAEGLIGRIAELREGSDRLIANLKERHPVVIERLEAVESSATGLFEAAGMIMGLENPGMRALMKESLRFVGKGGLQIDTKLKDNRFDHTAFLASIISYTLADVPSSLLCYSIFESLGDYFSDILTEMKNRSKAEHIVLCGSGFANQSLFSRVERNLKNTPPVLPRSFPIGRENGVVGGIYL